MKMTYGFVADALTGERLNVLQQCCELTVRSDRVAWPSHKTKSIPQPSERFLGKHLGHACLVVGGPASGKSILTRRVVAEALRRRQKLLPILIPVVDLARRLRKLRMQKKQLPCDLAMWYVTELHEMSTSRQIMLRQALASRRVLLIFDGVDEGGEMRCLIQEYVMRAVVEGEQRVLCTTRPEGFDSDYFPTWAFTIMTLELLNVRQQSWLASKRLGCARGHEFLKVALAHRDIATNPLCFNMMLCYAEKYGVKWICQQTEIYEGAISLMMGRMPNGSSAVSGLWQALERVAFAAHLRRARDVSKVDIELAVSSGAEYSVAFFEHREAHFGDDDELSPFGMKLKPAGSHNSQTFVPLVLSHLQKITHRSIGDLFLAHLLQTIRSFLPVEDELIGAVVVDIIDRTKADKEGVRRGCRLLRVNGHDVREEPFVNIARLLTRVSLPVCVEMSQDKVASLATTRKAPKNATGVGCGLLGTEQGHFASEEGGSASALQKAWRDAEAAMHAGRMPLMTSFIDGPRELYRFSHLTFQEYLVARVSARRLQAGLPSGLPNAARAFQDGWWRKVFTLLLEAWPELVDIWAREGGSVWDLKNLHISSRELSHLGPLLAAAPSVDSLNLHGNALQDSDIKMLAKILAGRQRALSVVCLGGTSCTNISVRALNAVGVEHVWIDAAGSLSQSRHY